MYDSALNAGGGIEYSDSNRRAGTSEEGAECADHAAAAPIELEIKMRYVLVVLWALFWSVPAAMAQVSIGIGLPGVSIGINLPLYPEMVQVPDYPVYYAPRLNSNFFYYDGMYWVYQGDNWYGSDWYNGPWGLVAPEAVPLFILRIPVRYYRNPPEYFRGWWSDAPPRWGEHWGKDWEQHRSGWDRWNHSATPALAPLPAYQRRYAGDRYPSAEQQQAIHRENYRYQPRDPVVQQHYQERAEPRATPTPQRAEQGRPQQGSEQEVQRSSPPAQRARAADVPRAQPQQRGAEDAQRPAPVPAQTRGAAAQEPRQPAPQQSTAQREQPAPRAAQREQQAPRPGQEAMPQERRASPDPRRGPGQDKERDKPEERGQERVR